MTFLKPRQRAVFVVCLAALAAALTVSEIVRRRVQRTLDESSQQVASASNLPFTFDSIKATAMPAGMRVFDVRGDFQSMVSFEGDWMIASHTALFRYDRAGRLLRTWRVGAELPPFPLARLAVRSGITQPELWIATQGGGSLVWGGDRFRQLLPGATELRNQTTLLALPDGRMLIGAANGGLLVSDTRRLTVFRKELRNAEVTALALGATSEEVWIGTRNDGAWLWRAGTLTHFLNELPDAEVLSIFCEGGSAWVGSANGVSQFADGRFERNLAQGALAASLTVSGDRLWIATVDQGTFSIDLKSHTARPMNPIGGKRGELPFQASALVAAPEGVLALGSDELRLLPENRAVFAAEPNGLANRHISALNADNRTWSLWIGYFNRGLDLVANRAQLTVKHVEDDVVFCVNRIKAEPAGDRVFVATANGLAVFDPAGTRRRVLGTGDGLISDHVTDILPGDLREGTVVATNAGLTFINASGDSSVYAFEGLVNNHVYNVARVGPAIVAGTLGGVSILRSGIVEKNFTTATSNLTQNWITASAAAGEDVYLGTYGTGVVRLNAKREIESFREFGHGRFEINANAMLRTGRAIYAGTAHQGLAFLPAGEARWRFWTAGLPSANVTALAADADNLYIGTDNGLVEVPERDLL